MQISLESVEYETQPITDAPPKPSTSDLAQKIERIPPVLWNAPLDEVFELFRAFPDRTFFPVISSNGQPMGLIEESKLRRYVYSSYGKALLNNDVYAKALIDLISDCPTVSIDVDIADIVDLFSKGQELKGILVEDQGHYEGFLSANSLLFLMHQQQLGHLASLNKAYQRFVPRRFLEILGKDSITDVQLGDCVQKNMSILFSDIRSFTTLSETLTPEKNFQFLNSYLRRMESSVVDHYGFVDKYIGDGILALFDRSADDALNAAIEMLNKVALYNQHRAKVGYTPIRIGIGINTGNLMLGTIGGNNYMSSTVISDAVNLSSRVEQLTKMYHVPLLITENTYSSLEDPARYYSRFMGNIQVKGKTEGVNIYEVFDGDPESLRVAKALTRSRFENACMLFQEGSYHVAYKQFQKCLREAPYDVTVSHFLNQCREKMQTHSYYSVG